MFAVVIFFLLVSVLSVCGVFLLAFLDVAFGCPPIARQTFPASSWRPPLASPHDLSTWAAGLAEGMTVKGLAKVRNSNTPLELAGEIYRGAQSAIEDSWNPPNEIPRRAVGCPVSRDEMIGVTPPEALLIVDSVRNNLTRNEVRRILARAIANARRVANLNRQQYEDAKVVCPLLTRHETCAAWLERPLQCRACLAGESGRETCSERRKLALSVAQGAELGLAKGLQSAGVDGRVYELNSVLAVALDRPDAAQNWADGKDVFGDCKPYEA